MGHSPKRDRWRYPLPVIEPTLDSAAWPCDFVGAQAVKLRVASGPKKPEDEPFKLKPDLFIAEAELRLSEIQDLTEQLPEIRRAAGSAELKFRLHLELDGRGTSPRRDIIGLLNELPAKISKELSFK